MGVGEIREQNFVEPPWEKPLDPASVVRRIPESGTVVGMFLAALADEARRRDAPLPSARSRYVPYQFYPMREHVQLLLEACSLICPRLPLRTALRKLGRQSIASLLTSTIGKIVLASKEDVMMVLGGLVKTYPVHVRPSLATILQQSPGRAIVRLEQIHFFLDCHHIGVLEGALRFAGKRHTNVRICSYSATSADLLCRWEP